MDPQRILIMGAAGRDFHNFNVYFRDSTSYEVVAFTAAQIPNIEGRTYPAELAGDQYPDGIPIHPESELVNLIREEAIDQVIFAYSDVSHEYVMHRASSVLAAGAEFRLQGLRSTQLESNLPVISIGAARTGSGKSQTSRRVAAILRDLDYQVAVVRHPMPYGDLAEQAVQRFASYEDLARHNVTIEEREEYEPHLDQGFVVYAGVDYGAILAQAEEEADLILWDGGNNEPPFYRSDTHIVVVDPLRAGHERGYHPGEMNVIAADIVVINKIDSAAPEDVILVRKNIEELNPKARIVSAASPVFIDDPSAVRGRRVLIVEDGPTLTHGEMAYGAGWVAARQFGAAAIVDPRPYAVGTIAETYSKYPTTGEVLPAMGYGESQMRELEQTINRAEADLVLIGTPIDLERLLNLNKPALRVRYELQEIGKPDLRELLAENY